MKIRSQTWLQIAIFSLLLGAGAAILEKVFWIGVDSTLPKTNKVISFSRPGTITILSSNEKIIQKLGPATQEKLSPGNMPLLVKQAFIAAEDRRFYDHKGVDLWGISRALIRNLREGSVKEGGSTITQQLARTVFLNQDKSLTRKLKEVTLSFKLERELSKEEILEQYLNYVYLGSGAYGIADASWVYFSKTPDLLSLEEAALIAGLAPAPSFFSPLVNPNLALKRRSVVLNRMQNEGFITKNELLNTIEKPLKITPAKPKYLNSKAPFFTSWVAQKLPEFLTVEQIELGGIIIKTSLNLDWQIKAREIIREYAPLGMEGAIVSIEPQSGLVRVLVGGKDFNNNQFNRATQALRSPGSTFKLFPYLAALKKGISPEEIYNDKPKCWENYCPKNFKENYLGEVTMAKAFEQSLNTIAVDILDQVGFKEVISLANKLGVGRDNKLGFYYPLAIGAYEQTLLNMTGAYAGIANRGNYKEPIPFEEIRGPNNSLIWSNDTKRIKDKFVVSSTIADTMNWMLQRAVKYGTGKASEIKGKNVAGKTGTSEGGRDLWFIGSLPKITTGVWLGFDDNRKTKLSSGEAANTWKVFTKKILKDLDNLSSNN